MLLVTSPSPGDGKTLTSINLAWSLADGGHRACLIDLDFRAPSIGRTLGLPDWSDGVAEALTGECTTSQIIRQVGTVPLFVVGIKESFPSPTAQFSSPLFKPWLTELRDCFEWVILDMAPAIPISDVAEVLPHVDGALLVIRTGRTVKSLISPTIEMLSTKLWGAVLNDSVIHGGAYYGNYGYGKNRDRKQ
jgi:capsular exopolysaccharide synthesis family protein